MFNFQKEVVINSAEQFAIVNVTAGGAGTPKIDKKLRVHGGGEYFDKYFVDHKIYKTNFQAGEPFTLSLHVPEAIRKEHIQILIELGLDNDYRGDYGSALWYFRKPVLVDLQLPNSDDPAQAAAKITEALQAAIPDEYKFIVVSQDDGNIIVKGADSYQKVRKVVINKYECEDRCGNGSEEPVEVVNMNTGELLKGNDYANYTANKAEFGTYEYLIHNLRLPTYANLRFTSPSEVEMPVKGGTYIQYSFAYSVPRVGFGGLSVVGQVVQSTTVHTFYVLSTIKDTFEAELAKLNASFKEGTDIVVMDRGEQHNVTILPDGKATTSDLAAVKEDLEANSTADAELAERVTELETKVGE